MSLERRTSTKVARGLVTLAIVTLFMLIQSTAIAAPEEGQSQQTAQEDAPYAPPEISVGPPPWLSPFSPLADLPVWAQAAVVSSGIAAAIVVIPPAARSVWRLVSNGRFTRESEG